MKNGKCTLFGRVYLDDILVTGSSEAEHMENLDRVLCRLSEYGLKLRKDKCEFLRSSVEYLGHVIDKDGVHKAQSKVKEIANMPLPKDLSSLRSYLGMLNYYRRYIPNLAAEIVPLNDMLQKQRKFKWSKEAIATFEKSKRLLQESGFLTHFDPRLPLVVATDASPFGIGAVLSHIMPTGEERPVMFVSRSLSKTECNYPQIEREALAIIFAVRKFYLYLYGRKFTLITDNKPLTAIFGPKTSLPILAAERMQRWAMLLAGFNYDIQYRRSAANANADCLSRLPCSKTSDTDEHDSAGTAGSIFHIEMTHFLERKYVKVPGMIRYFPEYYDTLLMGGQEN
jgi:hypothetical protein